MSGLHPEGGGSIPSLGTKTIMNYTRIQILNHDSGACGLRLLDEAGKTTGIIEMSPEQFRTLASQMLTCADTADTIKLLGPSVLKNMKQI